ncbi:carboxypeptidase-like regulatory domain-containing protein [Prevotella sp. P6B4]|uniref:carboxypeptidase-like regulatory domain-containing protein n=1 Tax=Prevotella sp. P6B4 TaxID=1410614 RepID=UPI00048C8826|nr:carboxypeptidase-like regulatory domain-containing protein [Prevotella sp. P6B4]
MIIAVVILQVAKAQGFLKGIVIDKDTHEAIVGATISDETKHKPLTVTDAEGRFVIPKRGDAQHSTQHLKITYIGYKPLVVTAVANVPQIVDGQQVVKFTKKMATPLANVSIYLTADVDFSPKSDLELDFLKRCLSIAYTDSVREEKGGTYGVSVDFELDKEERPNATLKIAYNADPSRYGELNPIIYQQLQHIADRGPAATSLKKVKEYLTKQYAQMAITNDYWSYIIWHELDDDADFDRDYCKLVNAVTAADVQRMAQKILAAKRCIEVTMLSE